MNKGLIIVGLVGVAAAAYILLSGQSSSTGTAGGGSGGSKKDDAVTQTYSETTTSPYEMSQPIFNFNAPPIVWPEIQGLPDNTTKKAGNDLPAKYTTPYYYNANAEAKQFISSKKEAAAQFNDKTNNPLIFLGGSF